MIEGLLNLVFLALAAICAWGLACAVWCGIGYFVAHNPLRELIERLVLDRVGDGEELAQQVE